MSLKNSLLVLWVYLMYVLGIWIFLSGFLLKRIVIHQHSSSETNLGVDIRCGDLTSLQSIANKFSSKVTHTNKTHLKRFDKVIILLIDALRYDFVSPGVDQASDFYSNKMPVFGNLVHRAADRALLFRLVADSPTTTLQRLTGITTGSLPTFMDVGKNFASSEIFEDSFIRQMREAGKKIVFMGDDTWESVFPNYFHRSFSYPSFNVKDLDTVDNGIISHLYEEIETNEFDVIIAHFLGVDHCGHRYGPSHPEMTRKLQQMNEVIEQVVERVGEDTLLIVLGDHGMTESGDHGGDSFQEVMTALFLFSKSKLRVSPATISDIPLVPQVDIVPTLSLLLGLPIPFSNLGSVIPEVFTLNFNFTCFKSELDQLVGQTLARAENVFQVFNYLQASEEFPASFLLDSKVKIENLSLLWNNITHDLSRNLKIISQISEGYRKLLSDIRTECKEKWATFNVQHMSVGCIVLLAALFINFLLAENISFKYCIAFVFIILLIFIMHFLNMFYFAFPFLLVIIGIIIKFRKKLAIFEIFVKTDLSFIIISFLFVMSFSNSFIIYEDSIILYILQSVLLYRFLPIILESLKAFVLTLFYKFKIIKQSYKINWKVCLQFLCLACLLLCNRLGSIFYKCREEKVLCDNSDFIKPLEKLYDNNSFKVMKLIASVASVVLPFVIFFSVMNCKYWKGAHTVSAVSVKYGTFFVCVLTSLRWWLNVLSPDVVDRVLQGSEIFLNRAAFFTSVLISLLITLFPFLLEQPWQVQSKQIYHGSFLSLIFCMVQLLQLISGDALSIAVMFMSLSTWFYVILVNTSTFLDACSWTDVMVWHLMSRHWFYATAHQATFTAIHWDAAFLLHHKELYSYVLSGALVIINTFSSYIFYGLALPVILTFQESSIFTSKSLLRLHMKYILCFGVKLLGTVLASFVLRHHLMVWKIFSPKLLYEILSLFISMVCVSFGHVFMMKITTQYHKLIRENLNHIFESKEQ